MRLAITSRLLRGDFYIQDNISEKSATSHQLHFETKLNFNVLTIIKFIEVKHFENFKRVANCLFISALYFPKRYNFTFYILPPWLG